MDGVCNRIRRYCHDQSYLNNSQKLRDLQQHVTGEAYVLSLKRLKYTFGQRSKTAQAFSKKGKKKAKYQR